MGSSPTKQKNDAPVQSNSAKTQSSMTIPEHQERMERDLRIKAKIRAYSAFMKCSPRVYELFYRPRHRRETLRSQVASWRRQSELDWRLIQEARSSQEEQLQRELGDCRTGRQFGTHRNARRRSIIEFGQTKTDFSCEICRKSTSLGGLACRVCTRSFHRKCLEDSGRYAEKDLVYFSRAASALGWSCFHCDDMSALLSGREMTSMMDEFDRLDVDRDATISKEEFVRYKCRQYESLTGQPVPAAEAAYVRAQFDLMDVDTDGSIDWWEFVCFEVRKYIASKSEDTLIDLLTEKEKLIARQIYDSYIYGDAAVQSHLRGLVVGHGSLIAWDDFLREHALYIIWSRPNVQYELLPEPSGTSQTSD